MPPRAAYRREATWRAGVPKAWSDKRTGSGVADSPSPETGDGWVVCGNGHRHWGRYGAAGLLLMIDDSVLLQHRSPWTHEGDTWGVLGGARDRQEDAVSAAAREANEEGGLDPGTVCPIGWFVDDHAGWTYTTVVAELSLGSPAPEPSVRNAESVQICWWPAAQVDQLTLHPGLRSTWPRLRHRPRRLTLVVDGANVIGSRPDGWWRDRAGATARLIAELVAVAAAGLPATQLPDGVDAAGCTHLVPDVRVITEGAARAGAARATTHGWAQRAVTAVSAPASGDDTLVAVVSEQAAAGRQVLAVTADRELARRVLRIPGAVATVGPRWILNRIHATAGRAP